MKSADFLKQIRGKTAAELIEELAALRKEQFNLRMQRVTGQLSKSNLTAVVRKKIARLQTVLKQGVPKQQAKAS
ncbi:MAG: 50S ribosomal protein L29 [Hydrocarboniphaga effusa]|nr:50S ribosomal protein L29 [Hydrocarboniphaga effusa]